MACEALDVTDPKLMKAALLGKLTGAADSWTQGRQDELVTMTFGELKEALREHFQGESMAHVTHVP